MRVGPIGPSPYGRGCLGGAAAKALRSKPAQKVPWAPQSTATRASRSRSKARNAARSAAAVGGSTAFRSEEHTSELQSLTNLVCRLLLEKKKTQSEQEAT